MAVGMNSITPEQAQRLHQNGQLEAAETAYRQLRSQFPGRLDIALALTYLLRDQGRRSAAADCIIDWWSQSDQGRLNGLRVVTLLSDIDRIAHAGPVIEHLVRRWPTDAAVLEQAAMAAQGRQDEEEPTPEEAEAGQEVPEDFDPTAVKRLRRRVRHWLK